MSGSIDPTRTQFDAFKALPRDQPIQMLNLVRVKEKADYPEGHPNHGKAMSGLDAYRAYGRENRRAVQKSRRPPDLGRQTGDGGDGGPTARPGTSPSSPNTPTPAPSWPWSPTRTTANG